MLSSTAKPSSFCPVDAQRRAQSPQLPNLLPLDIYRFGLCVHYSQQLSPFHSVLLVSKQLVHLLQRNLARLGNEEVDIGSENDVHRHKKEQTLQPSLLQEDREELLENCVGDVLHLRAHAHGLRSNVHREDLRGPDPGSRTPGRLIKEDE